MGNTRKSYEFYRPFGYPGGRFLCVKPIGTQWVNVDMFLDYTPQKGYNSNWTIQFNFTKVKKEVG